jgi:hypothetical protein
MLVMAAAMAALRSCVPPPIDIDYISPHEPRLTIASQIIPSQVMVVAVTRSFTVLDGASEQDTIPQSFLDSILVEHALVVVKYMGHHDTLTKIAPGLYASLTVLQFNYGTYELYVRDSMTGLEATATSVLLPLVPFDTITPVVTKTPADTTVKAKYEFTDPADVPNWYVVNFFVKKNSSNSAGLDMYSYFNSGNQNTFFELISDKTFNGTLYSAETELENVTASDTIAVTVSNISEGYFEFLTAFKRSGSLMNQLTGEPINYPTNVKGGYGYFNTHYPDVRIFDLNQY